MTATLDHPATTTTPINARSEEPFLRAATYTLTARQLVLALACHLSRYGDTLTVTVVDPLAAVDAVLRFDLRHDPAGLTGWATDRTPADTARVLARAEAIARDYFGTAFPAIPW